MSRFRIALLVDYDIRSHHFPKKKSQCLQCGTKRKPYSDGRNECIKEKLLKKSSEAFT